MRPGSGSKHRITAKGRVDPFIRLYRRLTIIYAFVTISGLAVIFPSIQERPLVALLSVIVAALAVIQLLQVSLLKRQLDKLRESL